MKRSSDSLPSHTARIYVIFFAEHTVVPAPKTKPRNWLHENVDREVLIQLENKIMV